MSHVSFSRRSVTLGLAAVVSGGGVLTGISAPAHAFTWIAGDRRTVPDRQPRSRPTDARWADQAYGSHPRQVLDVDSTGAPASPVVVFVHGGAWSIGDKSSGRRMSRAFTSAGFAFAALNYRFHPEVDPAAQAQDVAAALALLVRRAGEWGLDGQRMALIGHSAGAHLAALTALDDRYLNRAGVPLGSVRSVVLLDGAGYDVPRQIEEGENGRLYRTVFGDRVDVQRALSPVTYAGQRRAAPFQIHHVARRQASRQQAQALAERLRRSGGVAEVEAAQGESHMTIQKGFGEPGDVTTGKTLKFLQRHLA